MRTTITSNRMSCANSGNESLRDCRIANLRGMFRVVFAASPLLAFILLTGCSGGRPQFSNHNFDAVSYTHLTLPTSDLV